MKSNPQNPSFVYLKIFLVIFILLTLGTIITRTYQLFQGKTYDERFYSVALIGENDTEIISFTKSNTNTKLSKLHIVDTKDSLDNKTLFEKSFILGIPLSGSVNTNKSSSEMFVFPNTLAHLFGKKETGSQRIGDIDYLFMYLAMKKISSDDVVEKKVSAHDLFERAVNPNELSEILRSDSIVNQKLSISVINSSGISGVARRVADILEIAGYYVISVDSDEIQESTSVEVRSVEDLFLFSYLFGIKPKVIGENRLEDVKVIIGRNAFENL